MDPNDTIIALSSAPGPGGRAIVRISGPRAWEVSRTSESKPSERKLLVDAWRFDDAHQIPADFYFWPGPHSATGQDILEVHLLSSPPLVELIIAECLSRGARAAGPGEFTLRAFLAGKLDLTQAEAVLGVIEAGNRDELKQALGQLAGNLAKPLNLLREDLLNLLADVEAGLDFADEDLQFVAQKDLLDRLARGLALITLAKKQIESRSATRPAFRVALVGEPNAGKSSLFNALLNRDAALVSPTPGTTRDYLKGTLTRDGITIELIDTAGLRDAGTLERSAQSLGLDQASDADLLLWCEPAEGSTTSTWKSQLLRSELWTIATKADLNPSHVGLSTSAATGQGLEELKARLFAEATKKATAPLAPSLSRCRHHVEACLQCLRRAHAVVLHEDPPEILALELRAALEELGILVGAIYTDDLLDRIFSRFCIGK